MKTKTPLTDAHQKATAGMVGLECNEVYDFARSLERQMWEYYNALEDLVEEPTSLRKLQQAENILSANASDHRCSPEASATNKKD
jgi:rubrerythrin